MDNQAPQPETTGSRNSAQQAASPARGAQPLTPELKRMLAAGAVKGLVFLGVEAAILFLVSGRFDWGGAWAFVIASFAAMLAATFLMVRHDPSLMKERVSAFKKGGTWDKPLVVVLTVVCPLLFCVVAGLDARFGWSPRPMLPLQCFAFAVAVVAYGIILWAMRSNRFFSSIVRIQTDRGHSVQTGGPYRFVRHPGYLGMALSQLAFPLVLGTLWTYLPVGLALGILLVRTALEDRLLRRELPGYSDYAARVRFRLLPGVW